MVSGACRGRDKTGVKCRKTRLLPGKNGHILNFIRVKRKKLNRRITWLTSAASPTHMVTWSTHRHHMSSPSPQPWASAVRCSWIHISTTVSTPTDASFCCRHVVFSLIQFNKNPHDSSVYCKCIVTHSSVLLHRMLLDSFDWDMMT